MITTMRAGISMKIPTISDTKSKIKGMFPTGL